MQKNIIDLEGIKYLIINDIDSLSYVDKTFVDKIKNIIEQRFDSLIKELQEC
jgi:hypothetical protein